MREVTVLDVIEGYFGELPPPGAAQKLSRDEIEDLGDRVVESANAHPAVEIHDTSPIYTGGFLASGWPYPALRKELSLSLLYQPRILVHDPLADYFGLRRVDDLPEMHPVRGYFANGDLSISSRGPRLWAANLTYAGEKESLYRVQQTVDSSIQNLIALEPLLRSGAVVARPQWPVVLGNVQALLSSSRHDVKSDAMIEAARSTAEGSGLTTWDNLRGMRITPNGGIHPSDERWSWQPEFFYLAKSLAFADATGGIYVPGNDSDLGLLKAKLEYSFPHLQDLVGPDLMGDKGRTLLSEVARKLLPDFDLDPATAVKVRESEEAFEDWRRFLRNLERQSASLDATEVRRLVEDEVSPIVAETQRASRSAAGLKSIACDVGVDTIISVGTGAAATLASGEATIHTMVGGATAGVLHWIWRAYGAGRLPEDRRRVVATLVAEQ